MTLPWRMKRYLACRGVDGEVLQDYFPWLHRLKKHQFFHGFVGDKSDEIWQHPRINSWGRWTVLWQRLRVRSSQDWRSTLLSVSFPFVLRVQAIFYGIDQWYPSKQSGLDTCARQDDFAPGLPRFKAELKIDIEKFDALWVAFEVGSGGISFFWWISIPWEKRDSRKTKHFLKDHEWEEVKFLEVDHWNILLGNVAVLCSFHIGQWLFFNSHLSWALCPKWTGAVCQSTARDHDQGRYFVRPWLGHVLTLVKTGLFIWWLLSVP